MSRKGGSEARKSQIEERFTRVWRLWNQGRTGFEIAREIGVTDRQIRYDLKTLQDRWRLETSAGIAAHKEKALARNEELFREYWLAWIRSLEEKTTTSTEQSDGESGGSRRKAGIRKQQKEGNPAFLLGASKCIEQHCRILGIPLTTLDLSSLSTDDLIRIAQSIFTRPVPEGDRGGGTGVGGLSGIDEARDPA